MFNDFQRLIPGFFRATYHPEEVIEIETLLNATRKPLDGSEIIRGINEAFRHYQIAWLPKAYIDKDVIHHFVQLVIGPQHGLYRVTGKNERGQAVWDYFYAYNEQTALELATDEYGYDVTWLNAEAASK